MSVWSNLVKWQNYVHYFVLVLGIMLLLKSAWAIQLGFKQFAILYIFIFVLDTIVHAVFSALPRPYRWSD